MSNYSFASSHSDRNAWTLKSRRSTPWTQATSSSPFDMGCCARILQPPRSLTDRFTQASLVGSCDGADLRGTIGDVGQSLLIEVVISHNRRGGW